MSILKTVFLLLLGIHFKHYAQMGCTDMSALNYMPSALVNDGSCIYPATNVALSTVCVLDSLVEETSALIEVNNVFWTLNDSGGESKIYSIDTISGNSNGSAILDAINKDWEELAQSETQIFLGDFGNNLGTRTDLKIYFFPKMELTIGNSIVPDSLTFSYPDQQSFVSSNLTNFDCEAFIYFNDSLHLFSKNWGNGYCKHYTLPAVAGNYTAILNDSIFVDGQVTGASISPNTAQIILIGYKAFGLYPCFSYLLSNYAGSQFLQGNKRRFNLGSAANIGQIEGVSLADNGRVFCTNERISFGATAISAKLQRFNLPLPLLANTLTIPTFMSHIIHNNNNQVLVNHFNSKADLQLFDCNGNLLKSMRINGNETIINTFELAQGTYFIELQGKRFKFQK